MNIYVGNMAYEATENDLKSAFEAFGSIQSATIIKDKYTGNSKGFGFVEMSSNKEAQAAIDGLNDSQMNGRKITVNEARPRLENRRSNYGSGGDRGGFGKGQGGNRQRY